MAVYNGPKCKLCRREGHKLFLKGDRCESAKCPMEKKRNLPPGQHGSSMSRRPSTFGVQLREKQRVKRTYGVLEKQFRRYFNIALRSKGQSGVVLLKMLETRLDHVVYLGGLISSKKKARQFVTHGNVLVNNKKVKIPSYGLKAGDVVTLTQRVMEKENLKKQLAKKVELPKWLLRQGPAVKVARMPEREDIDLSFNEQLIVESYSR